MRLQAARAAAPAELIGEPGRAGPDRQSIHALPPKAFRTATVRSKPRIVGQEYLEVYLKSMEKTRLAKLGRVFGRLLRETSKRWELADRKMGQTQESLRSVATGEEADRIEMYRGG